MGFGAGAIVERTPHSMTTVGCLARLRWADSLKKIAYKMDSFTLRTSGYELKKSWPRSSSFLAKFDCLPTHNNTAPKIQGKPQKLHRFVKPRQRSWQLGRRRNVVPEF